MAYSGPVEVIRRCVSEDQTLPDLDDNAKAVAIRHIKLDCEGPDAEGVASCLWRLGSAVAGEWPAGDRPAARARPVRSREAVLLGTDLAEAVAALIGFRELVPL
jgi:hypothetical protein